MSHSACAFTMKALHLSQMMASLGHDVFHYGVEGSQVKDCCVEDVSVLSGKEQEGFFGPYNPDALYEVDWSGRAPYWSLFHNRAIAEINKRKRQGDFLCIITGSLSLPLVEAVESHMMVVEYGAGYNGLLPRKRGRYRVYESYAHMHKIWGAEGGFDPDGHFYDAVVPNYLNPDDYPLQTMKGDYYLYLGRLVKRKGIHVAVETCRRLGAKLKIAGQGCVKVECNRIHCADGEVYEGDNLEYVGFATGVKRARLYQNAIATFVPTTYIEPLARWPSNRKWPARRRSPPTGEPFPRRWNTAARDTAAARSTSSSGRPSTPTNSTPSTSTSGPWPTTRWTACGTPTRNTSRCSPTCGATAGTPPTTTEKTLTGYGGGNGLGLHLLRLAR